MDAASLWTEVQRRLLLALDEAIAALEADEPADAALRRAAVHAADDPALRDVLFGLGQAHSRYRAAGGETSESAEPLNPVILHQDWVGAREAMLRAGGVTLAAALVWLATGWQAGAFMMLGVTIMTTVFSTADNPVVTMRLVVVGQILGAAGALAGRWLVWPMADGESALILSMMPFILLGGFIFAHRGTAIVGFDYNMVMLLLLQPTWPLTGNFPDSVAATGAVILGPLIALLSYRLVFPINGQRRLQTLTKMMVHEIEAMATRKGVSRQRSIWRVRLYHRVLRLVRWAEKTGNSTEQVIDGAFAILLLGSAVLHIDERISRPEVKAGTVRRLQAVRARLRNVSADPARAARALQKVVPGVTDDPSIDRALLREAAAELETQSAFIRGA